MSNNASSNSRAPRRSLAPVLSRAVRASAIGVAPIVLAVLVSAAKVPNRDNAPGGTAIPRVTITARDFAYNAPDTVAAGVTELVLKNVGPDLHHVQLLRLEDGHTLGDLMTAMQKGGEPPRWAVPAGGPNAPMPGAETRGIVKLRAGRYVMLCLIPAADGVPHVMKGMSRELIVKDKGAGAPLPAADIKLTLNDYTFSLSRAITAGAHTIAVTNAATAPQPHELAIVKLAPGKSIEQLLAWMEKEEGPPPAAPVGGSTGLIPGDTMYVPIDFTPGNYAFLCFLPDAKDGKPHVMHGMMQTFTVK